MTSLKRYTERVDSYKQIKRSRNADHILSQQLSLESIDMKKRAAEY